MEEGSGKVFKQPIRSLCERTRPQEEVSQLIHELDQIIQEGNVDGAASVVARLRKSLNEQEYAARIMNEAEIDRLLLSLMESDQFVTRFGDNMVRFMRDLLSSDVFNVERLLGKSETLIAIYQRLCVPSRRREIVIDLLGRIGGWSELCALTFAATNFGMIMAEIYRVIDDLTARDAILAALGNVTRYLPPPGFEDMKCAFELLSEIINKKSESSYAYTFLRAVIENGHAWEFMCTLGCPINFECIYSVLVLKDVFAPTKVAIYELLDEVFRHGIQEAISVFQWSYVMPDFDSSDDEVVMALCSFVGTLFHLHLCVDDAVFREISPRLQVLLENGTCRVKIEALKAMSVIFRFYPELTDFIITETNFLGHMSSCLECDDLSLVIVVVESLLFLVDWADRSGRMDVLVSYFHDESVFERLDMLADSVPEEVQVTIIALYKITHHDLTVALGELAGSPEDEM